MISRKTDIDRITVLYCRIRRQQWGQFRNVRYRRAKSDYKRAHYTNRCAICHQKMKRNEVTIDHIIPLNICNAYNLPQLEFDHRNFRLVHSRCNLARGEMKLADLPEKLQAKILSVQKVDEGIYRHTPLLVNPPAIKLSA
ncbi:HNH endonuclease signature motif containing protein [Paeniglutamicibacter quisquiliarum]|uniref:HNH endonuclease signature motif containing protein n=1 Tax=Paeniglutamicibacter quisquiliarum TaxID=2849498 RepID=UPI003AB9AD97